MPFPVAPLLSSALGVPLLLPLLESLSPLCGDRPLLPPPFLPLGEEPLYFGGGVLPLLLDVCGRGGGVLSPSPEGPDFLTSLPGRDRPLLFSGDRVNLVQST